ncbi:hypothetical protein COLO4_18719 [Corchorus olitorius]|uniref:F-box domain-containing protein n=1 Tax=Corchorus olitorius TaxID=93759 RepID=A0A1R3J849_9ROSI|nr:hypothetical protein COLO4_18719 [Corchorus olitorius]
MTISTTVSCSTEKPNPNSEVVEQNQMQELRSYSDLPLDILGNIFGRLRLRLKDRNRLRQVCKDWSVLARKIPIIDKYPWALTSFDWEPTYDNGELSEISGERKLTNPPVFKEYAAEKGGVRGKEYEFFRFACPRASSYGWLLFQHSTNVLFLYCPFTREVIKLPEVMESLHVSVVTFRLDATSPKCVIFILHYGWERIYISICSPGDTSWKTYQFTTGFNSYNPPVDAAYSYANGNFYCVFSGGQLGAFNVGLEEWTILTVEGLPRFDFKFAKLIVSDNGDLQLIGHGEYLRLLKFDFGEKRWIKEINLKNRVLFIGCTSFSCVALGETSELANLVLSCGAENRAYYKEIHYGGSTSASSSTSQQYRNWLNTARNAKAWLEVPLSGVWTGNDLING